MVRYETLLLSVPEITKDESSMIEGQLEQVIKKAQGTVLSFDRWGKYRLAYPVRDNEYGIYFLIRFEVAEKAADELVKDVHTLLNIKHNALIMRSMTTSLDAKQSLVYQRPESLEEMPSRDVDSFLRENKMDGLLSTVSSDSKQDAMLKGEHSRSADLDI